MVGLPLRAGYGAPWTRADALADCLRLGVPRAVIDGQPIELPPPEQAALEVRLSPAICAFDGDVHGLELQFRRHRRPCWLEGADAELALHARTEIGVRALAQQLGRTPVAVLERARRLEAQGLVELLLKEMP
jgi:hypothetical protein